MQTIDEPAARVFHQIGRANNQSPQPQHKPKLIKLKKKQKRTVYRPEMKIETDAPTIQETSNTMSPGDMYDKPIMT